MKSPIRFLPYAFQGAGALILGYAFFLFVQAQAFQAREKLEFGRAIKSTPPSEQSGDRESTPKLDSVIGRIEIPRLHLSTMILEGDGERQLELGAGHVPGTALPGEPANVVIAAHRDTFFRPLKTIARNDRIVLTTLGGSFPYIVESVEIVAPDDTAVLRTTAGSELTLITCYPFSFVGPAPRRFVVHARKAGSDAMRSRRIL